MATWPTSLPTNFMVGTLRETPPDNKVSQQMGIGPPKVRRVSTAGVRKFSGRMYMTDAQVATFDTFYDSTLKSGVLPFDGFDHPRTGVAVDEMMIVTSPTYSDAQPSGYYVELEMEALP